MTQPFTDTDVELVARALAASRRDPAFTIEVGEHWGRAHWSRMRERQRAADGYRAEARAVLSALAADGRLTPAGGQPDVWEYGRPDPDEPDGLMTFDGTPRVITPRMVRRPMRAVGPWLPVPEEDTR